VAGEGGMSDPLTVPDDYRAFLEGKIRLAESQGFEVDPADVNPALKPHVRAIVPWACRGGRRAIFASFGLHKTSMQIEIMRLIAKHQNLPVGIVLPLGVRQEFFRDAELWFQGDHAVRLNFIRRTADLSADRGVINLTNYESVRDGKVDPAQAGAWSLDEASVLRGMGGTKTFREFMRLFEGVHYRFVATATPDPNDFIELAAYSAFLGVMDVGQIKTRYFKRDSEKADHLTLYPHKEREWWMFVASWALFLQKPGDLGFSNDRYVLPPLDIRWHEIPTDHGGAGMERDGQSRMFRDATVGVADAAREKRDSLSHRVAKTIELVLHAAQRPGNSQGISAPLSARVLSPGEGQGGGVPRVPGEEGVHERLRERQSAETDGEAARAREGTPVRDHAGTVSADADRAGLRMPDLPEAPCVSDEGGRGSLARDGNGAGHLVQEVQCGVGSAGGEPGESRTGAGISEHRTDVDVEQVVVWCDLNDEQRALEKAFAAAGLTVSSLYGSQSVEERERLLEDWRARRTTVFLSKTSMYGAGVNLQQCHRMIFAGVHFKFYEIVQGVHRIQRFGQAHPCTVDFIYTEAEREIRRAIKAKWARHNDQAAIMAGIIREYGLAEQAIVGALTRSIGVARREARGARFVAVNNDCVEEARSMAADSVDLIVTSIPFATQYEYTPSYNDFGHTDDNDHFWRQMDYLTPELLRVLRPGRNAVIHVKDRIVPGGINGLGFQTVQPFSDECVAHFRRHGFAFLARKTITTDVVRENNQTYRLGWTEQCKDGSRMGCGMPEYVLLFRKPPTDLSDGYADVPVVKEKPLCDDHGEAAPFNQRTNWKKPVPGTGYSRARWQLDAHGFARSSGDRLLSLDELATLPHEQLYKLWRDRSRDEVYDFAGHVAVTEGLDHLQRLPSTFMLLPPHSAHPDVWTDVARMRTLNGAQSAAGREQHLCPLPLDIVERAIVQFSMPGEAVLDPFMGIGTVPFLAVKLGRNGLGIELNALYWRDAVGYCQTIERDLAVPTLFDLLDAEAPAEPAPGEAAE